MRKIKKAKAQVKYTDRQGQQKNTYRMVGFLWKDDEKNDISLTLDSMPVGDGFTGRIYFYDIEDNPQQQGFQQPKQQYAPQQDFSKPHDTLEDDIPFSGEAA